MEYQQALLNACLQGDVETVNAYAEQFIHQQYDLNFTTEEGRSLLSEIVLAAASNPPQDLKARYVTILQQLLQMGLTPDIADPTYGRTTTHWAAYNALGNMLGLIILAGGSMGVYDNDGLTPFHAAIASESIDCIKMVIQLMKPHPEILEVPSAIGLTPLMYAVQLGNHKVCQLLIKTGCDPNARVESTLQTPLHIAAEIGHGNIVELLLKYHSTLDASDADGVTPVHIAAALPQSNVIEVICGKVGSGVLELTDNVGMTALMYACSAGSEECVKYILKQKIDVLVKESTEEKNCLHLAAGSPSSSGVIIELLCKRKRQLIEERDMYGRTPLHYAAMSGNIEAIKALKKAGCDVSAVSTVNQYNAIHWATVGGQADAVVELIHCGCSLLDVDENGATALHLAAAAAALPLDKAVDISLHLGALNCIKILLESDLSISVVDSMGQTPLHWALQYTNNIECIKLLISEGGDPLTMNDEGLTGLHIAAKSGATDACQYLIEAVDGVRGDIEDSNGQTALFYAIESQAIECSNYLLSIGCSANHRNHLKRSPAHIAASIGSLEGLQLLYEYSGDFNLKSTENATPLHDAASNGHTVALQYLLQYGADPNINGLVADDGPSPLHFAVSNGHKDCVEILLQNKCNVNPVTLIKGQPLTPYDYVTDDPDMLELLQANGAKPGTEVYTPPSPIPPSPAPAPPPAAPSMDTVEEVVQEDTDRVELTQSRAVEEEDSASQGADVEEEQKVRVSVIRPVRKPRSRPTSGTEVFDHMTQRKKSQPNTTTQEPSRKTSILSFAMNFWKQKPPPTDSIQSSTLGLYAAQATMLAGSILGTPLGMKTVEIASKVASDTAEELKRQAEETDYEETELDWTEEPEKEPTPTPEPTPEVPPTPPPSPPPTVEFEMDQFERRMRKAKAQMDQTKSLGFRAVEELLKAQSTQSQLKRQFVMSSLKEDCEKRRKNFISDEDKARQESDCIINSFSSKMDKASKASKDLNQLIDKQLDEAHKQNKKITAAMTELGINPRPTVAEWLAKKQEQKRAQLKDSLKQWERNKHQREMAISVKQAITSRRALQHVAWGIRKDLTAQVKALDKDKELGQRLITCHSCRGSGMKPTKSIRLESGIVEQYGAECQDCNGIGSIVDSSRPKTDSYLRPKPLLSSLRETKKVVMTAPPMNAPMAAQHYTSHIPTAQKHIRKHILPTTEKTKSSGCVRATPIGFMKFKEQDNTVSHDGQPKHSRSVRRTSSLPDSLLWDMGQSYVGGSGQRFYSRIGHRAYGPKGVRPGTTLTFLPPEEFNKLKRMSRSGVRSRCLTAGDSDQQPQAEKKKSSPTPPTGVVPASNTSIQYHSLMKKQGRTDGSRSTALINRPQQKNTRTIPAGQVLPMRIMDKTEVVPKITA